MNTNVKILATNELDVLVKRYPQFEFMKSVLVPDDDKHTWNSSINQYDFLNQKTKHIQVVFIGKTGYGKSTTINKLLSLGEVFATDPVNVCTRDISTAMYRLSGRYDFLSFSDLPGISEGVEADKTYIEWYRDMIKKSDVVVYVLSADSRDYTQDIELFQKLKLTSNVILAINKADLMEPKNFTVGLNAKQIENLRKKEENVSKIFGVSDVLSYSAKCGMNLSDLMNKIFDLLCRIYNAENVI